MFEIHISPSLQIDYGFFYKERNILSFYNIEEKSGDIVVFLFPYVKVYQKYFFTIERIDEDNYLGWLRVVQIVHVTVKIYFSFVFIFECTGTLKLDCK
jgi:hypothetical protein